VRGLFTCLLGFSSSECGVRTARGAGHPPARGLLESGKSRETMSWCLSRVASHRKRSEEPLLEKLEDSGFCGRESFGLAGGGGASKLWGERVMDVALERRQLAQFLRLESRLERATRFR
jgi:hypothetical protein